MKRIFCVAERKDDMAEAVVAFIVATTEILEDGTEPQRLWLAKGVGMEVDLRMTTGQDQGIRDPLAWDLIEIGLDSMFELGIKTITVTRRDTDKRM